jgi:hypothetical protein
MNNQLSQKWQNKINDFIKQSAATDQLYANFASANDSSVKHTTRTAHAVVNISSAHIINFCNRSRMNQYPAYLNCYDLGKKRVRLGDDPPTENWEVREIVDKALETLHHYEINKIYFMAAELNGTGVRFYGDICLVLKDISDETIILDRNSYELIREPLRSIIEKPELSDQDKHEQRCQKAFELAGEWGNNLGEMASVKILTTSGERDRRLTAGQISTRILDDEDYIEVLKTDSFSAHDLECVRLSALDVALENYIFQCIGTVSPPEFVEYIWLRQRQKCREALIMHQVPVTVVVTEGRTKS